MFTLIACIISRPLPLVFDLIDVTTILSSCSSVFIKPLHFKLIFYGCMYFPLKDFVKLNALLIPGQIDSPAVSGQRVSDRDTICYQYEPFRLFGDISSIHSHS